MTWTRALAGLSDAMTNAVLIGVLSSALATILAIGALEYEYRAGSTPTVRALVALYLPLLVPQIAFLFGLQIVFTRLALDGTLVALILVHLCLMVFGPDARAVDLDYAYDSYEIGGLILDKTRLLAAVAAIPVAINRPENRN